MEKIKIVLCDDHAMLRAGLKLALQTESGFEIIGEADNGDDAVKQAVALKPDVIIMDINMPKINGIEASRIIKKEISSVKILMLTMHEEENYIKDALSAGIDGYMLKMSDMKEFLKAVRIVAGGNKYFHENVVKMLSDSVLVAHDKPATDEIRRIPLTKREKEIMMLIAGGNTSQEIAEKLFISYFTVGKHRKNIIRKLELKNTAELIKYALQEKM
ncbi:MAG: response regulator transcription factor [Ignavibacteria bacterium]